MTAAARPHIGMPAIILKQTAATPMHLRSRWVVAEKCTRPCAMLASATLTKSPRSTGAKSAPRGGAKSARPPPHVCMTSASAWTIGTLSGVVRQLSIRPIGPDWFSEFGRPTGSLRAGVAGARLGRCEAITLVPDEAPASILTTAAGAWRATLGWFGTLYQPGGHPRLASGALAQDLRLNGRIASCLRWTGK
jgi:hypothetical protein